MPVGGVFWRAASLAVAVTTCAILPVFLVGGLAVQIRAELGLSVSVIGLFTAAYFASAAVLSTPAGRLGERIGARAGLRSAAALAALALGIIAASQTPGWVGVGLVIGGAASSLGQVTSNLYLANATDVTRHGLAFGIKQAAIPAATLIGGLSVPFVALSVGWRWAFAGAAALALVIAVLVPRGSVRPLPREHRPRPETATSTLVVIALAGGLGSAAANSLGAYLVDSSVAAGVDPGAAGFLAASGSAVGVLTRVGMGWLADRVTSGRMLWVAGMLAAGAFGFALLATRRHEVLVVATALCFAGGWGWPGLLNFAVVLRNRVAPAAATGVTQTGVYVGGSLGPLAFGLVADGASYALAWSAASVVAILAAVCVIAARTRLLRETAVGVAS